MAVRYSPRTLINQGLEAEESGDPGQAAKYYYSAIKQEPTAAVAYNRLMIYYRRKKDYKRELQVIRSAIAAQQERADNYRQKWLKKSRRSASVAKALLRSLGLVDKKGLPVLEDRQVVIWKKRLAVVNKRLKTS
jgi:tetratricopeptide (TPR) repeat protein